jgi:two-component system chemotaxis response regulator CheB
VIGGSAGALGALKPLVRDLDPHLPVAIFVAIHTGAGSPAMTADLLSHYTGWTCVLAVDGDPIRAGRVVLARPDHHLLLQPGRISTPRGPKENGFRPAVDPLFRTAAIAYGEQVIGVILSGGLDDGAHGLTLVKQRGGITIVQDPGEALAPSMPMSAIRAARPHHVLPVARMAPVLTRLTTERVLPGASTMSHEKRKERTENDPAERGDKALANGSLNGPASGFTCPDCGGALWEFDEDEILRYRCHVGHAFNGRSLVNRSDEVLETALWTALRTLEETAALRRRMADKASLGRLTELAASYQKSSEELEQRADVIRTALIGGWKSEARQEEEIEEKVTVEASPRRASSRPARRK